MATEEKISLVWNEDNLIGMARYPDKFFDLAIVDPPYGLGATSFSSSKKRIHKDKDWNNSIPSEEYFNELFRVSKHQIIWGCNYYEEHINANGRIVHDKLRKQSGMHESFSDCDLASNSVNNLIKIFRYGWEGNCQNGKINWDNSGVDGRIHPTQKPISLYKYCLRFAKPGDKILDTHMGSQSSRIAAWDMGFDYWGWELDKEYFDAGCKRFNDFKLQGKLFNE